MEKTIDKILDLLVKSNDYLSGEYIGALLGISRIAVNKQIKKIINVRLGTFVIGHFCPIIYICYFKTF